MNSIKISISIITILFLLSTGCATIEKAFIVPPKKIDIYVVNPMIKVFQDDIFNKEKTNRVINIECASNEYEAAQFVIRSNTDLNDVSVRLTDLINNETGLEIPSNNLKYNFLGYIPLETNTPDTSRISKCGSHLYVPDGELICRAPCMVPDPLLEIESIDLEANKIQPVWVTVVVPKGTPGGIYEGEVIFISSMGEEKIPIELEVYPFELPDERHLYLTNWFETIHIAKAHDVELYSDEYWEVLKSYAKNMYEHRQNVVYTPWQLVKVYQEEDGHLSFDYTDFDKYVETFIEAGVIGLIELYHVAHHGERGRAGTEILLYKVNPIDRKTGGIISLPGDEGMAALLSDLHKHLDEKGWLSRTIIHVADEPSFHNLEPWKEAARFVRKHAPGIRTIDAIGATGFGDLLDIMVPLNSFLDTWLDSFKEAQKTGSELWFYTCCVPYGHYPNRFLDYSLGRLRILHWMNYAFDISGYLHWGFTYGWDDAFGVAKRFPPGDSHIIYPGENGPMNSIRWEIQKEAIEDFEYFKLLQSKVKRVKEKLGSVADFIPDDFRSKEICKKLVKSLSDYIEEPESFYSTRKLLASEIENIDKSPLILLVTDPPSNIELTTGPPVVKVYGVVENGATIRINGRKIIINPDGSFLEGAGLSVENNILKVEVEKNGQLRIIEREFKIR